MSSISAAVDNFIYVGFWTNWSYGKVFGATLTLTQRDGSFLIAFLAMFVSYVGTCFFRLTSFTLHTWLSSPADANDTLYHQRQAILRNAGSGAESLERFFWLLWYWRKKGGFRTLRRVALFIIHALLCVTAFIVAGIFSSRISTSDSTEVLLSSSRCGYFQPGPDSQATGKDIFEIGRPFLSRRTTSFMDYVQSCYLSTQNTTNDNCNGLTQPRIPYIVDHNAGCPFPESGSICQNDNANIRLDTGHLDVHEHFGINTRESERVSLRSVLHCAPLSKDKYAQTVNVPSGNSTTAYRTYSYGQSRLNSLPNATYQKPIPQIENVEYELSGDLSYGIGLMTYFGTTTVEPNMTVGNTEFDPIPELQVNNSDIHLIYLTSRNIQYMNMTDDPWFSAHSSASNRSWDVLPGGRNVFYADEAAPALGCVAQYEACFPDGSCSSLSSISDTLDAMASSENYKDLANWIGQGSGLATYAGLQAPVKVLGGAFLGAKYSLGAGTQIPLPSNQWQSEVERLFQITLAEMQISFVDTATGPDNDAMWDLFTTPPVTDTEHRLCRSQKIHSTGYSNFSVFGLGFTLGLGSLLVLVSWTAEAIYAKWMSERRRNLPYALMEWTLNGTLQLQRLAHERSGHGVWVQCSKEVPITVHNDALGRLDLSDIKHPRLSETFNSLATEETKNASIESGFRMDSSTTLDLTRQYRGREARMDVSPIEENRGASVLPPSAPFHGQTNE